MSCTYPECDASTTPGIHLCQPHKTAFADLLERAPSQVATARETVRKQGSNGAGPGGSATVSSAPINLTAMVRVDEYVRLIEADPLHIGPEPTVERVRTLARSSSSGPTLAHLERAEARMMAVTEAAADWLILGPCAGTTDDGEPCPGQYRYLTGDTTARCRRCPYEVSVDEYRRWQLRGVPFAPARLTDVVRGLGALGVVVRLNTVKSWAHRGRLVPVGFRGTVPLYRAGDVLDLLQPASVAA